MQRQAKLFGGGIDKVAHAVLHAGGNDKILGLVLLQHQPLHFHVIPGVAPVAFGFHIAEKKTVLQAKLDARQGTRNLARDKCFTADRRLMVKQNAITGIETIRLAVIHGDPVAIHFGHGIRAARVKRGGFGLRNFLHQAIQFARRGLVKPGLFLQPQNADGFEHTQHAQGVRIGRVFRFFKAHRNMGLRSEVINFIRLGLLDDADEAGAICHVAMVQKKTHAFFMAILIQVVDAVGIEQRGAPLQAMHDVAFVEQEFGQVSAILPGHAGNQCNFLCGWHRVFCFP